MQMMIAGGLHSCILNGRGKQWVLENSLIWKRGKNSGENIRVFSVERILKFNYFKQRSTDFSIKRDRETKRNFPAALSSQAKS